MPTHSRSASTPAPLLSEDELRRIGDALQSALYRGVYDLVARVRVDVVDELRFAPMAREFALARERRSLDLKAAAKLVKAAQYAIQQIERGNDIHDIPPGLLERYAEALGIAEALARWKRMNPELVLRLGRPKGQSTWFAMIENQALAEALAARAATDPTTTRSPRTPTPERPTQVLQLKIVLEDVEPPIWRRVLVTSDTTLRGLHRVIQDAMGWTDTHLYQFEVGDTRYSDPDLMDDPEPEEGNACVTRLGNLDLTARSSFRYEYDFGDGWGHVITVEKVREVEGDAYPSCVGGARSCPPEDCGGPYGYMELLSILGDPDHPEHAERQRWVGRDFDPERFEAVAVNAILEQGRRRKPGGKRVSRKS